MFTTARAGQATPVELLFNMPRLLHTCTTFTFDIERCDSRVGAWEAIVLSFGAFTSVPTMVCCEGRSDRVEGRTGSRVGPGRGSRYSKRAYLITNFIRLARSDIRG